jgi:ATP-dependent DNA ligase
LSLARCYNLRPRYGAVLDASRLGPRADQRPRVKETILDGEVMALDPEGRQDFRGLLALRGNLHYAAFDV